MTSATEAFIQIMDRRELQLARDAAMRELLDKGAVRLPTLRRLQRADDAIRNRNR